MEQILLEPSDINVVEVLRHDFHFPGHLLPGTAFMIMGFWWIINSLKIYFSDYADKANEYFDTEHGEHEHNDTELENNMFKNSRRKKALTATYNGEMPGLLYCEGFYKLIYASVDLACHLWVICNGGNPTVESQHMTIYVFFILESLVNILNHTRFVSSLFPLGTDYILSSITWTIFGYLFLSHKHGKDEIQIYYHSALAWVAISVGVMTLVQFKYDQQILTGLARGICCALAGTWLYQIAFTFHNPLNGITPMYMGTPSVDLEYDHKMILGIMKASSYLTWHLLGNILVVGFLFKILSKSSKSKIYYCRVGCC